MKRGISRKYFEFFIFINLFCGFLFYIATKTNSSISGLNRHDGAEYLELKRLESNWTRILIWTTYFGSTKLSDLGLGHFKKCGRCLFTFDRNILPVSDGVVFHGRDLFKNDLPYPRYKNQMWIFMLQESPSNTVIDLYNYANAFNWTMTYRQDSDIFHPYGQVTLRNVSIDPFPNSTSELKESLRKKNLVAWIVSHCETDSGRENYAKELSSFVPVDIYGDCGKLKCFRDRSCYPYIAESYKFYLSFENSYCVDYVTEKFFNALRQNIVPIVLGEGNYSSFAPPGSFIDIRDFGSAKELSEHLVYLDSHPDEYLKYFEWKKHYKIESSHGWCSLCRRLRERKRRKEKEKFYVDLAGWWNNRPNSTGTKACREQTNKMNFFYRFLNAFQFNTL